MPPSISAAIVDLDGTMVDTLDDFHVALLGMLADLRLPPVARDAVAGFVGKGSEHLIRCVLRQAGVAGAETEALLPAAWAHYQRHYLRVNGQHSEVFPGVVEGLTALRRRGLRLACLTNKPTAFALPLLRDKGLDGFFGPVFGGDAFARKKPDPLPLIETCRALGCAPAQTLMVGDSVNDALAARAAGCPVALVSYGYNHGEPVERVPHDVLLASLAELPRWLDGAAAH